jgi:FlaA1/EpsC-like NDP-sugar epimerase
MQLLLEIIQLRHGDKFWEILWFCQTLSQNCSHDKIIIHNAITTAFKSFKKIKKQIFEVPHLGRYIVSQDLLDKSTFLSHDKERKRKISARRQRDCSLMNKGVKSILKMQFNFSKLVFL